MKHLKSELFKYLEVLTYFQVISDTSSSYRQLMFCQKGQYLVTSVEINALNAGQYYLAKQALFFSAKKNHI